MGDRNRHPFQFAEEVILQNYAKKQITAMKPTQLFRFGGFPGRERMTINVFTREGIDGWHRNVM
jgi:hypothetical protein